MSRPSATVRGSDVRVTPSRIRSLARRIAERFHPQTILLFGSQAWGHPTPDSDVDLLVILSTRREGAELAAEIAHETRPPFPVDILVRTPSEIRRRMAEGDLFLREILYRGRILYEAGHSVARNCIAGLGWSYNASFVSPEGAAQQSQGRKPLVSTHAFEREP